VLNRNIAKIIDIKMVKMEAKDIERDPIVARILEIYDVPL
jgi:phosphate starvation-inducible protein PhoH